MIQTNLQEYEQKRLEELQNFNYINETIICDVTLSNKLKRGVGDVKRRIH